MTFLKQLQMCVFMKIELRVYPCSVLILRSVIYSLHLNNAKKLNIFL